MDSKKEIRTSKFLSLVLRHRPEEIGLVLDHEGWANVKELLDKINSKAFPLAWDELIYVVNNNTKKRFTFSENLEKIRANQGHSIEVDLQLRPIVPPKLLYHGTKVSNVPSILLEGILKKDRQYVHLSSDPNTAYSIGNRHGKAIVLEVSSLQMHKNGTEFYLSKNGIWLTELVAPQYIRLPR